MKIGLFTILLSFSGFLYSQDNKSTGDYPNEFTSGSANVKKFDNKARKFNDWAISIGGGTAILHASDLTSLNKEGKHFGWNAYISLDKQISDKFGLNLQFQTGKTTQTGRLEYNTWGADPSFYGLATATTKYNQLSLIGDVNFSNFFRRTDNKSPFRWSLHGYAGIGLQGYNYERSDERPLTKLNDGTYINETFRGFTQPFRIDSFFYQGGAGVKFNISKRLDVETRVMYIITGDDEFDGGGETPGEWPGYNQIRKNFSDNLLVGNLGLTVKLGKHDKHLAWNDPTRDVITNINTLERSQKQFVVCKNGDKDKDGVCDDWDKQLDTPLEARVDGSGIALDMDFDTVIDLYDKCVTVPGKPENEGCPYAVDNTSEIIETSMPKEFEGIVFELDKDIIRPESFARLNYVAEVMKELDKNFKYLIIGATDTRGTAEHNMDLSQRRAKAVVDYLINKGVDPSMLTKEGRGKTDLKYPECQPASRCPEWKNEANRRVYFKTK